MQEREIRIIFLRGKPKGNRPPGRPERRWEDTIKGDLKERVKDTVEWNHMTQNRNQ
jgi:hypothetical protein